MENQEKTNHGLLKELMDPKQEFHYINSLKG